MTIAEWGMTILLVALPFAIGYGLGWVKGRLHEELRDDS